jgi:16S rRNA (guanine966-N2)-methyltransferase
VKPAGLRVASGALRGRKLGVPDGIRPTEQKVREALFSIWGDRLPEASLLDLFAGSGAVGIEAVSRGAFGVTLVESHRPVLEVLRRNAAILPAASFRVLALPVDRALDELRASAVEFDLIFADPPYAWLPDPRFFAGCAALLRPGGALAVEHSARVALPVEVGELVRTDSRRYGESALAFFGKSGG